ncbi:G2/mitotic-specific cyclin-B3 [Arvicanthis niloticus]|uniref:G2/mitotic-specific cyclin-B3 n=1 Tax=Arvicanthis niloticus TaxID=61156 RepID=UPI0014865120|nr:G2/mitotic-specific cyclin-B3 [Arvicanthis niloticus]
MPLPLVPKKSNLETEKAQSNKITPREEQQSEKVGKSNHTASPSSSRGTVKKRSAFEDVTNASHVQCVQPKKDNIELRSCVFKRTKKGVGEITQKKVQSSKLGHVTTLSNMEKKFILDILNKPKIVTTDEPYVFQKTLVLNEKPATEETCLMKKTLKSCAFHQETLLMEKPLTLPEKTEDYNEFDTELVTSKRKDKPEEATIIEEMTDLKKPFIGKMTLTSSTLYLNSKHVVQEEKHAIWGKSSFKKKLLALKMVTTKEKPPVKMPHSRKKEPTTEMKSLLQEPSSLQEKYNTQGDASISTKPQVLQENTNNKDDTLTDPVTFKRKHSTSEATHTKKLTSSKNTCDTQGKDTNLRPLGVQPVTDENEPMASKKSTPKTKDSYFHGPSVLPDKHIPQMEVSTVEKSLALKNPTTEEKMLHFPVATDLKKGHNMEEAPHLEKSSPLMKQQQLPKRRCFFSNSAVQETVTNEPLSFKKSTTEKDPPFHGLSALQKKHNSPGKLSKHKKHHVSPKHHMEEDLHFQLDSAFKKQHIREEPASTREPLKLEMQQTIPKGMGFHLRDPLALPTVTSEAKSLTKEPPSFRKENTSSLIRRKCATHTITSQQAQSEWQETTDEDGNLFSIKPGSHRKEPTPEFLQNPSPPTENCLIPQKLSLSMPLASQKTTSQEITHSKESVASSDDNYFSQDLFSPFSSTDEDTLEFHKSLDLQEKVDRKNDSPQKIFDSQGSISEEESFLRKLFCKDRHSSSEESSQERIVALEQEFVLNKLLNENTSSDVDEPLSHQSPHTQNHSGTTKEALEASEPSETLEALEALEALEPLNIQEELITENIVALMKSLITEDESIKAAFIRAYTTVMEAHTEKSLSLEETSINEVATLKEPLTSQEKHRADLVTVLKELLVLVKNPKLERVALAFQENPPSNIETLLKEVLALVKKSTDDESTVKEPLSLQGQASTKAEVTPKKLLALEENSSIKRASPKDSLAFDPKSDIEKGEISSTSSSSIDEFDIDALYRKVLELSQGFTDADQFSFIDPQKLEENKNVDEEELFKSFLSFENENSPNLSSNASESRTDNFSALVPSLETSNPVMNSNPCVSSSKSFQSTLGEKETEIIRLDDSDTLENTEKEDHDPLLNSVYDKDIFIYLKEKEKEFIVEKYMDGQMELTSDMRAILVDWLVEIQTSFYMSHETLYLAVKIIDRYLMKAQCKKSHLQLLGSTAYMIAAKFEESYPPSLKQFLYICEDVYQKSDMVSLENNILKTLDFDINIPTAYNFLRRYASCIRASMKTLTLSRFICEMTLQEYDYVEERPSKLAAASFMLALYMRNLTDYVPLLEYHSGYQLAELHTLVRKLNHLLNFRSHVLKNVYEKYLEETYFEVAKIPPLSKKDLEALLDCALFS